MTEQQHVADLPAADTDFARLEQALDGRTPVLFLDYDGTLTPIVARPELAVLDEAGRAVLHHVADTLPTAVVSGRDRADVEKLVGLDNIIYAGSHGFDIRLPDGRVLDSGLDQDALAHLEQARRRLVKDLGAIAGAQVEPKRFTVAAHYRHVAEQDLPAFEGVIDDVLATVPHLRRKAGKKVVEIQPDYDWDKGRAVLWLRETLGLDAPDQVPLFLGDDITDEDAFAALQTVGGFGILVEPATTDRQSAARFRLDDPTAALRLLARLAARGA